MHQAMYVKDQAGYIFFSKNTTGSCGRAVKIHCSVFMDFYCAVDISSADGQKVIRDIENLRTNPNALKTGQITPAQKGGARHLSQLDRISKTLNEMKEGTLVTANVRAYFHVHQKDGDNCPTVYISEVKVRSGSDQSFGLYEERHGRVSSSVEPMRSRNLRDKTVFISGAHDSTKDALKAAKYTTNKQDVSLYYNPPSVAEDLGVWKTNRLSDATRGTIEELKCVLKENEKNKVDWFVEGEGASVLSRAVESLPGSLDQHTFTLINSKTNTPRLLQQLSEKKAQFNGDVIRYTGDRAALLAMADQKDELSKQIGKLPGNVGYNQITRRYLTEQVGQLAQVGNSGGALPTKSSLRGSNTTFVDALNSARKR